jgi:predicted  nucleic acid-binding Zn-ribbon protein
MDVSEEPPTPEHTANELDSLRDEVTRLRNLVGPSEKSYEELAQDSRTARDAARRAELETGRLQAQIVELENEVRRWQRDFVWFRDRVVRKIPLVGRAISRFRPQ